MREIVVDNFAGGGGASLGIAEALGREPDLAINHDAAAIMMHAANHTKTRHITEDLWKVDPVAATEGYDVGLAWFSPDCRHFSRAKGAVPVKKEIRSLAWVVIRWAAKVSPRVIILENVREFEDWGPLIHQKIGGKYQFLPDGSPALVPDPNKKGYSFRQWAGRLRGLGYEVQWRILNAADYGAPTQRKRLFLIARCDGKPIVWPAPTHASPKKLTAGLLPWRTAAECIDWTIPCPSIFERKKPLADNTLRRIALGIKRYVLENPEPFIVQVNHSGAEFRGQELKEPLAVVTSKHGYGVVNPFLARLGQTGGNGAYVADPGDPLTTITSKAEHMVVTPHITKFRTGSVGSPVSDPLPTVTSGAGSKRPAGAAHALGLVAATLVQTGYGEREGQAPRALDIEKPLGTVVNNQKHALVSAFLAKHFGGPRQTAGQRADTSRRSNHGRSPRPGSSEPGAHEPR